MTRGVSVLRMGVVIVVSALALPGGAANAQLPVGTVTEFTAGITGFGLGDIAAGPDGNLWFTENNGFPPLEHHRVARITPSGTVTEFTAGITRNFFDTEASPEGITAGPDGNLWFTEKESNERIGRITTAGAITEFPAAADGEAPHPRRIASGSDGNLWFTSVIPGATIVRLTPGGMRTSFTTTLHRPQDIAAGPDGNLWFTADDDTVGRITTSGTFTKFSAGISPGAGLSGIAAGPDGNLWFTERASDRIGRITTAGTVTEFTAGISPGAGLSGIAAGPDGNLWFAEADRSAVGRITPNGAVTEFTTGIAEPNEIVAGPDGNLWFTTGVGAIGRISPGVASPPPTPPPPAAPPPATPGPVASPAPPPVPPGFAASPKRVTASSAGVFTFTFTATAGHPGTVTFVAPKTARTRRVALGSARFTAPASGRVAVRVKLSRADLRMLRKRTTISVVATVTLDGRKSIAKFTLRARKSR